MDPLSTALRGVRLTGALFFNAEFSAPWGYAASPPGGAASLLAPGTDHLVFFHLVTEGEVNIRVAGQAGQETARVGPGEIAVLPRGDAHELWNGPVLRLEDGARLLPKILSGALDVERGGGGGAVTRMVCGYFGCDRDAERLFLAGLPPLFTVNVGADPAGRWLESSIRHAVDEIAAGRAGRSAVLDRLMEALFLETFCRYADRLPPEQTGWLAAARDPIVGDALAAIHRDPARPWTLDELARAAGTSRTVLVERFARYLGESPQTYLARWRLQHAARLLETTDRTVLDVALEAGYASEASFNRAFKRRFDLPPARYRRRHRDGMLAA
jgi:AraC-like DNA-binding protein